MSSRFNSSSHQRDARAQLFSPYDQHNGPPSSLSRPASRPPSGAGYGFSSPARAASANAAGPAFSAYPGSSNVPSQSAYRTATPNARGQYSDAVLNELESQNDEQLNGMSAKVQMLKNITLAIGEEIRDSTAFAEKMNDSFDSSRARLRGTMNRMFRMAERSGVGWRAWLTFSITVVILFWYVWLF